MILNSLKIRMLFGTKYSVAYLYGTYGLHNRYNRCYSCRQRVYQRCLVIVVREVVL